MKLQQSPTFSQFTSEEEGEQRQLVAAQNQRRQQVAANTAPDPFAMKKYDSVQYPDTPLQFGGGVAESLLNDNEVPDSIKEKFWFVFHKDNTLTFLDEERKRSKLLNFDIAKIDMLNTMPYYEYTFDEELKFGILRNVFETKLDRALGFKGTAQKNERIVLQSQFQENRMINDSEGTSSNLREGFFKRLLGRR